MIGLSNGRRYEGSKPVNSPELPFLVFGAPCIGEEEIAEVLDTIRSGWLGTGPRTATFQEEFRLFKKAKYAVAVNSCSAALHLSLLALNLEPGDEVITTPLTFVSTVNSIIHAGAVPVIVDVDPTTMNLDPQKVVEKISSRTRAIIPVHFAGRPCDMNALESIAVEHSLEIIEDCAHAIETSYFGREAGTVGRFGCFSFYATKNLTTVEGGMLLCQTEADANRLRRLALHGLSDDAWSRFSDSGYRHYHVIEPGYKYNMTDLQAAFGIAQLKKVRLFHERRKQIWNAYQEMLSGLPIILPEAPEAGTNHAMHLYTIQIPSAEKGLSRDEFLDAMTDRGVGVGVHYLSVTAHPFYRDRFGWSSEDVPVANRIGEQTVSLPLMPSMTDDDIIRVVESVRDCLRIER